MPDEFDVFLSHNSRDKPAVEEIAARLRARGLRVWLDKDELRPGFPWQEGLEEGVKASRSVAVFLGKDGLGAWQEPEMRAFLARARREGIPVIPVLLPGCPESPQLSLFLEAMTWVDLREGLTDEGLGRLVWGITGTKSEGAGAVPASPGTGERPGRFNKRKIPKSWWNWGVALLLLGVLLTLAAWLWLHSPAAGTGILLVARDLEERPRPNLRFAYQGSETLPTTQSGATELDLKAELSPGQQIEIGLVAGANQADEWFLVNSLLNVPAATAEAKVVLMRRSAFRQIAAEARDASRLLAQSGPAELTAEDRKRVLIEAAARHDLTAEQLETALRSFAETQDPKDKGIAAYLEGEYSQAEDLLKPVVEKKESDLVETLRFMGAAQYKQAKYHAAADTFRKAVALRGEDTYLLSWLVCAYYKLAKWTEAEPLIRRALAIDKRSFGPDHPNVARDLHNLAGLLQATNRHAEAEPLMRRALAIDEKSFGPDHPNVASHLNILAFLLQATNRFGEAEPLMRRALTIDKKSFGADHLNVALDLNNLATLLQATNRHAEAEPLMRRAVTIFENSLGRDHPNVATVLNNLAQLLQDTNRLAEAEPLMRRALAIVEKSFGANHPNVAIHLNNLAQLLQATNRLGEAEPLIRRALAIDEKSFGKVHPDVAIDLKSLAKLLQATNRLAEAEPLMSRALTIFLDFEDRTGHEHPKQAEALEIYRGLLKAMGKSDAEIEAMIEGLGSSSN